MSSLAAQQQALLAVVLAWPADDAINNIANYLDRPCLRGLKAYQTNAHALAERALQAAYPVLTQLLGQSSMGDLARAFWHAQPPQRGDIAQWGGTLAEFVRASEQLRSEPYLPDVAQLEWALHLSASAGDAVADPASFALLMQHEPDDLHLRLAPGCGVWPSAWPVASIVTAHLQSEPDLQQAGQRLRAGVAETALVWRADFQPCVRETLVGEADFLQALCNGASLSAALNAAPALDFNAWLPLAVQSQLLLGVRVGVSFTQ